LKGVLSILALLTVFQGQVLYQDPSHDLVLSGKGVTNWSGETLDNGDLSFRASGDPLVLEAKNQGATITTPRLNGTFASAKGADGKTMTYAKVLHAEGGTTTVFDGQAAYAGDIAKAQRLKQPTPPEPKEISKGTLKTDHFDYAGSQESGTFTLPVAFDVTSDTKGMIEPKKKGDPVKAFLQNMEMHGSSGVINLNPGSKDKKDFLKTGHIEGPITFHMDRSESVAGAPFASVGKLDGQADKLDLDLVTERTVTLSGHVKLNGDLPNYISVTGGEKAVLKLNDAGEIVSVTFTGSPTTSTIKEKKGGGKR